MGKNIKRSREDKNYTQEYMGDQLQISQQAYSKLETRTVIEQEILEKIAHILETPVENFMHDEHQLSPTKIIQQSGNQGQGIAYNINPIEKIVELYERLLEERKFRIETLEATVKAQQVVIDNYKSKDK